jgi:predicted RNA binding protein YcfA (HicA-like mRNA interferase family)
MVSEEATQKIIRRLKKAGFVQTDAKGSHTK